MKRKGAAVAAGPTLEGEELIDSSSSFVLTSFRCTAAGGTASFTSAGNAVGPYPGTYEATASVTSGPLSSPAGDYMYGQLTSLVETFTITSGGTTITGTKTLSRPGGEFVCQTYPAAECTAIEFSASTDPQQAAYVASIGGTADFGTATFSAGAGGGGTAYDCAGQLETYSGSMSQQLVELARTRGVADDDRSVQAGRVRETETAREPRRLPQRLGFLQSSSLRSVRLRLDGRTYVLSAPLPRPRGKAAPADAVVP